MGMWSMIYSHDLFSNTYDLDASKCFYLNGSCNYINKYTASNHSWGVIENLIKTSFYVRACQCYLGICHKC